MKSSLKVFVYRLAVLLVVAVHVIPAAAQRRPGAVQPLANANGDRGDVILDGDATYGASGVVLRSKSSWPDITAQLGSSALTAQFRVVAADGTAMFAVQNGYSFFSKNSTIYMNTQGATPFIHLQGINPVIFWKSELPADEHFASAAANATGLLLKGGPSKAVVLMPSGVEAMRAAANGNVGIGTPNPDRKLHIVHPTNLGVFPGTPMTVTISDSNPFTTPNTGAGLSFDAIYNSLGHTATLGIVGAVKESTADGNYAGALTFGTRANGSGGESMERMRIRSSGEVVVGSGPASPAGTKLTVNGDVVVNGNIGAKYQDLAEWVPADRDLTAGTVVVLSATETNQVTLSTSPYDTRVAGVVSDQPGILLGVAGERMEKIATTGRVRVRVDAGAGTIAIGDLLVTSHKPGVAMKSMPVDLAGIAMHRPGTIVGKALEPLAGGEGEILVLLSLQ